MILFKLFCKKWFKYEDKIKTKLVNYYMAHIPSTENSLGMISGNLFLKALHGNRMT